MIKHEYYKGFDIIRYFPDINGEYPQVGALTDIHRNELAPLVENGNINNDHPLIEALRNHSPQFEMLILANPFHDVINHGQRFLTLKNGQIDPNRIASLKHYIDLDFDIEHLEDENKALSLINKSQKLMEVTRDLFLNMPILSLHADAPYWMSLDRVLKIDDDIESYTYAYISWNKSICKGEFIENLWNEHIEDHPYKHLIANEQYLSMPEQSLGSTKVLLGRGIIKDDDPLIDGSFENQFVAEGISPLTICFELPLTTIEIQEQTLQHFFERFLTPLLLEYRHGRDTYAKL